MKENGNRKQIYQIESVSLFLEVQNKKVPEYKGVIRLKKTDVYTGEPLTGAEFTVYQWNQEKKAYEDDLGEKRILRYDSDRESYYTEELLITEENGGKFRIVETKNPENYKGNYDKTVVFEKKEGALTSEIFLQAENTPVILPFGTITVMKKIKEADIIWAHGNPTFFFSVEGTDLAGVSHHYEDYVTFVPDSYEVDENGYAVAAVTFQNIPLGQYTVWEKPCFTVLSERNPGKYRKCPDRERSRGSLWKRSKRNCHRCCCLNNGKQRGISYFCE